MEGISHEAAALAGAWKLNKLIALWDDNGISIDGQVTPWFGDDTPARFEAYGWNVIRAVDGHNVDAVDAAIALAKKSKDKPTLICCKTSIGKGSPNRANTAKAHGEPLGADEIALTRAALGWTHAPFEIPAEVYADWDAKAPARRPKPPGTRSSRPTPRPSPPRPPNSPAAWPVSCPPTSCRWPPRSLPTRMTPAPPWPAARPASWPWKA